MSGERDGDSLYDTLGVDTDASEAEITRAYRRLAREHHPDTSEGRGGEAFSELTDAYDVLRDPERRRAYDDARHGRARAASAAASGVRIPIRHGTAATPPRAGRPREPSRAAPAREVELRLSFDQAALGTTAVLSVEADRPCDACGGSGVSGPRDAVCAACQGTGASARRSGGIAIRTECAACGGSGREPPQPCVVCAGSRIQRRSSDVSVRVPPGVDSGARLRIPVPGGGEIVGVVRVAAHPYFTRDGPNLHLRLPITLAEAALGAVVTVPTLDSAVAIRIPAGTPHGRTLRVRGRGVPLGDGQGDLLVTVEVAIPSELNEAQRGALEAFAEATESPRRHLEAGADHGAGGGRTVDPASPPRREDPHG